MLNQPERHSPGNVDLEQSLLGTILVNNDTFDRIEGLAPEHFYEPLHGRIFDTAQKLVQSGKIASPITLKTFFEAEEDINPGLSVPAYIARLAANAAPIISAVDHAKTIRDLATRRDLIMVGEDIVNAAYDSPVDFTSAEQISQAEGWLYQMAEHGQQTVRERAIGDAVAESVDMAARARESDGGIVGLPTGLVDLDAKMGGLQKSNLNIIAGRPSMGKSALLMNFVRHSAGQGHPWAIWSGEMSDEQLATRMIASESGVSSDKIRRGVSNAYDLDGFKKAADTIGNLPITIDCSAGISIDRLAAKARRWKRQHRIEGLGVDYLQLMSGTRKSFGNRVQEITEITMGLKGIAKDLNIPVVALSQLSRAVETRDDKRPQLSDLRESGSIEQDADTISFVYREEYYLQKAEPPMSQVDQYYEWQKKIAPVRGIGEIITSKNRHGPCGTTRVKFTGDLTQFSNLSEREAA